MLVLAPVNDMMAEFQTMAETKFKSALGVTQAAIKDAVHDLDVAYASDCSPKPTTHMLKQNGIKPNTLISIGFTIFRIFPQNGLDQSKKGLTGLIRWVAPLIVIQNSDMGLFRNLVFDRNSELQPVVFLAGTPFFEHAPFVKRYLFLSL